MDKLRSVNYSAVDSEKCNWPVDVCMNWRSEAECSQGRGVDRTRMECNGSRVKFKNTYGCGTDRTRSAAVSAWCWKWQHGDRSRLCSKWILVDSSPELWNQALSTRSTWNPDVNKTFILYDFIHSIGPIYIRTDDEVRRCGYSGHFVTGVLKWVLKKIVKK